MKVGIIGAGFGGLTGAYRLLRSGVEVNILEKDDRPGGLAIGFKEPEWKWSFERHYHHWFTNDYSILRLASEVGQNVITVRPKTSVFVDGKISQFDSPISLFFSPTLPLIDRLRMGAVLFYLKANPDWKSLEKFTAQEFIKRYMGKKSWQIIWRPLFEGKFHDFSSQVSAAWFWARIKKRTSYLSYPEGGFLEFAQKLDSTIRKNGGKIFYKTEVQRIQKYKGKFLVKTGKNIFEFDKVICTLPSYFFVKITEGLPNSYVESLLSLKGIGAINLLLILNKQFLEDKTYWLNINASHFPFIAVVEHTNFMDKKYYANQHLVYIGNYLPHNHPHFRKETGDLLREFYPFLKTINPKFDYSSIIKGYIFKSFFAQPIIPVNYSKIVPLFETPLKGLYLCNIQQVYPWDRGTNYAVENAEKVVKLILNEN